MKRRYNSAIAIEAMGAIGLIEQISGVNEQVRNRRQSD
jgi:hypothetical protein